MPGNYNSYIPLKDADLDAWATNFASVLTADPASYGATAGQASSLTTLAGAFTTALATATNPATRTSVTVAAKDNAKALLVIEARTLAMQAQAYGGITPALLAAAGLTVRLTVPSPIPAPSTKPLTANLGVVNGLMTIAVNDEATPDKKYKPFGAVACQHFVKYGGAAPATVDDCQYLGQTTRTPQQINLGVANVGTTAWIISRWVTRKGLTGPVSDTLEVLVA